MKRLRFTEQIIAVLREQEAGMKTADIWRKHGISDATLYKWKAKYGGLDVSDAKRLQSLEDENGRLKRMLADAMAIPTARTSAPRRSTICRSRSISSEPRKRRSALSLSALTPSGISLRC
jgi:putative transposase